MWRSQAVDMAPPIAPQRRFDGKIVRGSKGNNQPARRVIASTDLRVIDVEELSDCVSVGM